MVRLLDVIFGVYSMIISVYYEAITAVKFSTTFITVGDYYLGKFQIDNISLLIRVKLFTRSLKLIYLLNLDSLRSYYVKDLVITLYYSLCGLITAEISQLSVWLLNMLRAQGGKWSNVSVPIGRQCTFSYLGIIQFSSKTLKNCYQTLYNGLLFLYGRLCVKILRPEVWTKVKIVAPSLISYVVGSIMFSQLFLIFFL